MRDEAKWKDRIYRAWRWSPEPTEALWELFKPLLEQQHKQSLCFACGRPFEGECPQTGSVKHVGEHKQSDVISPEEKSAIAMFGYGSSAHLTATHERGKLHNNIIMAQYTKQSACKHGNTQEICHECHVETYNELSKQSLPEISIKVIQEGGWEPSKQSFSKSVMMYDGGGLFHPHGPDDKNGDCPTCKKLFSSTQSDDDSTGARRIRRKLEKSAKTSVNPQRFHEKWCGLDSGHIGQCIATLTRDLPPKTRGTDGD